MPVIYIDVLFVVNLIINYLLLYTTRAFSGLEFNKVRVLFGAIVGACYAVLIFFPDFSFVYTTVCKILISMLIIAISFSFYSIKNYVKSLLIFYAVSFAFGGCVLGIFCFSNFGAKFGAIYSNGVLYFNLPWTILALSWLVFYISLKLFNIFSKKALYKNNLRKRLIIYLNNKTAEATALFDTGNSLIDPISLAPVIIVEYRILKNLFNENTQQTLERLDKERIEWIMSEVKESGLSTRLIPFSSLGKENGMLLGFVPDKAEIYDECGMKILNKCVIGISKSNLSNDKSYGALLNPYL